MLLKIKSPKVRNRIKPHLHLFKHQVGNIWKNKNEVVVILGQYI